VANEFKYAIRAEDKSKQAIDSAQRNMGRAEQSAKRLGNVLKSAFTVGAIIAVGRTVARVASDLEQAYAKQEAAERKLAAAVKNNPMLDPRSQTQLQGFASELLELMAMAAAWGRNEGEIKTMTTAAADLSAGLGMDLQTAMRGLNNLMEGNVTTLSRYIPALRDLTDEQIANGDAMEIVNKQFGGMAEAMRDTTEGSMKAFANAWGDLKEEMGERAARRMQPVRDFFRGLIEDFTSAIAEQNTFIENQERIAVIASGGSLGGADADPLIKQLQQQIQDANRRISESQATLQTLGTPKHSRAAGYMELATDTHNAIIAEEYARIARLEEQLAIVQEQAAEQQKN